MNLIIPQALLSLGGGRTRLVGPEMPWPRVVWMSQQFVVKWSTLLEWTGKSQLLAHAPNPQSEADLLPSEHWACTVEEVGGHRVVGLLVQPEASPGLGMKFTAALGNTVPPPESAGSRLNMRVEMRFPCTASLGLLIM